MSNNVIDMKNNEEYKNLYKNAVYKSDDNNNKLNHTNNNNNNNYYDQKNKQNKHKEYKPESEIVYKCNFLPHNFKHKEKRNDDYTNPGHPFESYINKNYQNNKYNINNSHGINSSDGDLTKSSQSPQILSSPYTNNSINNFNDLDSNCRSIRNRKKTITSTMFHDKNISGELDNNNVDNKKVTSTPIDDYESRNYFDDPINTYNFTENPKTYGIDNNKSIDDIESNVKIEGYVPYDENYNVNIVTYSNGDAQNIMFDSIFSIYENIKYFN
jgi:hypothetical protein